MHVCVFLDVVHMHIRVCTLRLKDLSRMAGNHSQIVLCLSSSFLNDMQEAASGNWSQAYQTQRWVPVLGRWSLSLLIKISLCFSFNSYFISNKFFFFNQDNGKIFQCFVGFFFFLICEINCWSQATNLEGRHHGRAPRPRWYPEIESVLEMWFLEEPVVQIWGDLS